MESKSGFFLDLFRRNLAGTRRHHTGTKNQSEQIAIDHLSKNQKLNSTQVTSVDIKKSQGPGRSIRIEWEQEIIRLKSLSFYTLHSLPGFPFPSAWNGDDVLTLHGSIWGITPAPNRHAVSNARNQTQLLERFSIATGDGDEKPSGGLVCDPDR